VRPLTHGRLRETRLNRHLAERYPTLATRKSRRPSAVTPQATAPSIARALAFPQSEDPRPQWREERRPDATRGVGHRYRDSGRFGAPATHDRFDDDPDRFSPMKQPPTSTRLPSRVLTKCPYCGARSRQTRLNRHLAEGCPALATRKSRRPSAVAPQATTQSMAPALALPPAEDPRPQWREERRLDATRLVGQRYRDHGLGSSVHRPPTTASMTIRIREQTQLGNRRGSRCRRTFAGLPGPLEFG